jgi:Beta-propeller repeat
VVLWATVVGGAGNIDAAAIDVNAGGTAYVTGYFQSGIGPRDLFLAAISPAGVLLWIRQYGFAGNTAYGRGISIDTYGNVFMTGDFDKKINFQGIILSVGSMGNREAFVVKCNLNGTPIWAKQSTNSQWTQGNAIKATGVGEVYVAGIYSGPSSVNFGTIPLLSNGPICTFVMRFGINGNPIWGLTSNHLNTGESPMGISYDAYLNIYIAGNVQGAAKFGAATLVAYGGIDAFVAKVGLKGAGPLLPDVIKDEIRPSKRSAPKKAKQKKR